MTDPYIAATRGWIERVVVGLNLCPFARRVVDAGRIRFAVTDATDTDALRAAFADELTRLAAAPRDETETAILIHPHVLGDFLDYNDFLADADELLAEMDLDGVIQVASFHPRYRFAGKAEDDPANATNRSPYPMLHLLREASVSEVADAGIDLDVIPERNVALLRKLGPAGLAALLARKDAP